LSEAEKVRLEEQYFADNRVFEQVQIAEMDLIDAYVRKTLPPDAHQHLEARLATSPRLRERVAFARTFAKSIDALQVDPSQLQLFPASPHAIRPAPRFGWWKDLFKDSFVRRPAVTMALAAGIALVLLGGAAVIVQSVRLHNESQRLEAERAAISQQREELNRLSGEQRDEFNQIVSARRDAQNRTDRGQEQLKELLKRQKAGEGVTPPKGGSTLAFLTLLPGSLRSEGAKKDLIISPGTSAVKLTLVLQAADYPNYRVLIKGPQNKEIQRTGLRPGSAKSLSLQLPARQLASGDYSAKVSGVTALGAVEPVSDYAFQVTRK